MIPARIGSKRIPKKNLRPLNGKPLVRYILETAKKVSHFAEVYLNADDEIFRQHADESSVSFYLRPKEFGRDTSTNDEFVLDFLEKHECDIIIQLLPTSPFLQAEEIMSFIDAMVAENHETFISVEPIQIACVYQGKPINFDQGIKNPPSQTITPVLSYASAIMGWKSEAFKRNMRDRGCAYHGTAGRTGYFHLRGLSTVDIDREEDFVLADAIMRARDAG